MTKEERELLLSIARVLRAALTEAAKDGDDMAKEFRDAMNDALRPFDPLPGIVNEASR